MPDGLDLGGSPARTFFAASLLHRAEHYEAFFYWLVLGQTVVTVVVFALYAWRGRGLRARVGGGADRDGDAAGDARLRAGLARDRALRVCCRCGGSAATTSRDESYGEVLFGGWVAARIEVRCCCSLAVLVAVGLAKWLPRLLVDPCARRSSSASRCCCSSRRRTWCPTRTGSATRGWRPPRRGSPEQEGVKGVPIREEKVHTKDPNAFTTGLGPSRKVFVWSSMLDGRFTDRQVEVVIAHEYGHQARNHLLKGIAWYALFTVPLAYLIAVVARRRGGMREAAAIPLVLLVYVVFSLAGDSARERPSRVTWRRRPTGWRCRRRAPPV